MEKIFKARWWDYSKKKFNINGRVCLETMIPFGILGTSIVYIINPLFLKLINFMPLILRNVLAIILLIVYIIDNVVSFNVMNKIKLEIGKQKADNTEVIKTYIVKWLQDNSFWYRHIKNAYPKFKISEKLNKNILKH